jgi:hypothetical protein
MATHQVNETSAVHFWSSPTERTDLSAMKEWTGPLRSPSVDLFSVTQGLVIHAIAMLERDHPVTEAQRCSKDPSAIDILRVAVRLNAAPLAQPRDWNQLVVGDCFHSAILYCALLRDAGLPARARCGFVGYLIPGLWTCHWVVERWDQRWILDDPDVNLRDLDPSAFRSGADAWHRCRSDDDPSLYGLPDSTGWHELQGSVVCDVAALAKDEHLAYVRWPLARQPLATHEEELWLDEAAAASANDHIPAILAAAGTGFDRLSEDCA